jgi:hypothetical protein
VFVKVFLAWQKIAGVGQWTGAIKVEQIKINDP